jgi:hypothetical protein
VTIDARRHAEIVRDMTRQHLRDDRRWWRVGQYWSTARAAVRNGLDVGQTVSISYGEGDVVTFTDVTGRLGCPKGSTPVRRFRSLLTLHSPSLTFVLPAELLTQADVEFLAGPGPDLPLSLEVTQAVQDAMVDRATRVVASSADFLLPYMCALAVTVLAAATQLWGVLVVTAFFLALAVPGLVGLARMRRRFRRIFPVGWTLRAMVTDEQLRVAQANGTVALHWDQYTGLRVIDDAVLLRLRRPLLTRTRTQVLPRALFGPEELGRLQVTVPQRF